MPECPRCGHDDRSQQGFRWDVLAYLAIILALLSLFWMSSYDRDTARTPQQLPDATGNDREKLPGARQVPFQSPYQERGR